MTADMIMNDEVMKSVEELRERMKSDMEPEMYEDIYLFYRFLKVRGFNVNDAETMIRKHLEWREKYDLKNIVEFKVPEVVEKYYTYAFLGYDKEGCVVRYIPAGTLDPIGLLNSIKFDEAIKTFIYLNEDDGRKLKIQSKKLGRNVEKCVYIFNMENLSFTAVTDKRVIYNMICTLNIYQNNYPRRVKAIYVINSSVYFMMVYGILKSILSPKVMSKFRIYTDDTWKEDLLKEIDADVLPAFLGGNRTDPDGNPLCLTLINHGEPVPEKYYIHKSKRSLASMPGVKKIVLPRAAFHEEYLHVKEPGSYLEWEFETKCRDIGFGVFYVDDVDGEEEMIELIPFQRIDTEEYSETGTYMCEKAGKYVFLFDNTYSWIRSKEIYYRINIVTPGEQESQVNNA